MATIGHSHCWALQVKLQSPSFVITNGDIEKAYPRSLFLYLTESWRRSMGYILERLLARVAMTFCTIKCMLGLLVDHWLQGYLEGRGQLVELNATKTTILQVKFGVPQGSLLGPRPFSVRMSIIFQIVSLKVRYILMLMIPLRMSLKIVLMKPLWSLIKCQMRSAPGAQNRLTIHTGNTEAMVLQRKKFVGPLLALRCGERLLEWTK